MPSRQPVAIGVNKPVGDALSLSTEAIRAQILTGMSSANTTAITRENLMCSQNGNTNVKMESQRPLTDEALNGATLDAIEWGNNTAKKQMDMQFHFSCGPLRVPQYISKNHWDRLHTSTVTAIPQPGGGIHVITSTIPHKSDEELAAEASKVDASQRLLKKSLGLPPIQATRPPSTPQLRKFLEENAAQPIPKRGAYSRSVVSDGSSIFSRTTVASGNGGRGGDLQSVVQGKSSPLSEVSLGGNSPSVVSTSKRGVKASSSSVASSKVSNSSRRSVAQSIKVDLDKVKSEQEQLADELREAAKRLAVLEDLLGK